MDKPIVAKIAAICGRCNSAWSDFQRDIPAVGSDCPHCGAERRILSREQDVSIDTDWCGQPLRTVRVGNG